MDYITNKTVTIVVSWLGHLDRWWQCFFLNIITICHFVFILFSCFITFQPMNRDPHLILLIQSYIYMHFSSLLVLHTWLTLVTIKSQVQTFLHTEFWKYPLGLASRWMCFLSCFLTNSFHSDVGELKRLQLHNMEFWTLSIKVYLCLMFKLVIRNLHTLLTREHIKHTGKDEQKPATHSFSNLHPITCAWMVTFMFPV